MADIAIVGGGPGGAWAAWHLAAAGARVTIFDASHPREKPCGGGVTGRALALIASAVRGSNLPRVEVRSAIFEADGERSNVDVPLHDSALAIFSRTDFDRLLLDRARERGADLVAERVTDINVRSDGVTLRTAANVHRADIVIGADGANSLVRRRLGCVLTRRQISIGTGFLAHGVESVNIIIRIVADPPGYIWSFPRTDHLAIGICAQADAVSADRLKSRALEWIATSGIAPHARLTPYSWPIPSLVCSDFAGNIIAGDRWLLVGDAAGLVDPITREGIFFALESAELAAKALIGNGGAAGYKAAIARSIYPELERAARMKAGFFRPHFSALLMHALRESVQIRTVMADLVAGRQLYRGLKRRLLTTWEVGIAWRLAIELGRLSLRGSS